MDTFDSRPNLREIVRPRILDNPSVAMELLFPRKDSCPVAAELAKHGFLMELKLASGVDFRRYVSNQHTRMLKWFADLDFRTISEAVEYLTEDPANLDRLINHTLINVTSLFRNSEHWEFLEGRLKDFKPQSIRCLSAGCSNGAEAWTLSMILHNLFAGKKKAEIIGIDLDTNALTDAPIGIFYGDESREVPQFYREKYLVNGLSDQHPQTVYLVNKDASKPELPKPTFLLGDLFNDDLGGPYDVICFRNVGIYFNMSAKLQIYERLCAALSPGGYLVLGSAERIFSSNLDALGIQNAGFQNIYQKRETP